MTEGTDRTALEQQVLERASSDPQFRQQLMEDPRGTVQRDFGVSIPESVQITVLEETPSAVYLVLPAAPIAAGEELSDGDLEAVAGGGWTEVSDCHRNLCAWQPNR